MTVTSRALSAGHISRPTGLCAKLLLAALLVACGDDGESSNATTPQSQESKIYDVPIPPTAIADPASDEGREIYQVEAQTMNQIVHGFYLTTMPAGRPYNGLDWCSEAWTGRESVERVWRKPSTNDFLVLQVSRAPRGSTINVTDDKGNATRTC